MTPFKTPLLIIVFNRPELTKKLIESLEAVKPKNIFVVADGAREGNKNDKALCREVRELFDNLNWSCNVTRKFRNKNLGCAKSVSQGITWFFERNEMGIILEDDCIADPSFFTFSETLLHHYKYHEDIFHISGNNFQFGKTRGKADYYFSVFNHIWGWATWKRAWDKFEFDIEMNNVYEMRSFIDSEPIFQYFSRQFEAAINGKIDSWGFRWTFACWKNKGLSILPNKNLVTNIGFGPNATHTHQINSLQNNLPIHSMNTALTHPKIIKADKKADLYSFRKIFQPRKKLRFYLGQAKRMIFTAE